MERNAGHLQALHHLHPRDIVRRALQARLLTHVGDVEVCELRNCQQEDRDSKIERLVLPPNFVHNTISFNFLLRTGPLHHPTLLPSHCTRLERFPGFTSPFVKALARERTSPSIS